MATSSGSSDVPHRAPAPVLAGIAFVLALVLTYAGTRAYDALFGAEPNPATVLYMYGGRIAMFWRVTVGAYVGGGVAILVAFLARTRSEALTRVLVRAVPIVAVLVAAQAIFLP